jgi:hypothetical protein
MGYYVEVAEEVTLDDGTKIQLPLGKKNALAVTEALKEAGIDAQLYFESEPKKVE